MYDFCASVLSCRTTSSAQDEGKEEGDGLSALRMRGCRNGKMKEQGVRAEALEEVES